MTDIFSDALRSSASPAAKTAPAVVTPVSKEAQREEFLACIELFYFAYRDFTAEPDAILAQYGFGRAHHRVLHFVHRNPGLKVAELLDILKITKQSLARVLKQLVDEGFIIQRAGDEDRRERRLYLSAKGTRLSDKLTQIQIKRIEAALAAAGPGAEGLARGFLFAMISDKDRSNVASLLNRPAVNGKIKGEGE